MKRINNIFQKITTFDNIQEADRKARKKKKSKYGIIVHDRTKFADNYTLQMLLKSNNYKTSKYTTYKIYEPKEREIYRLPYYPDRITHHAIMNIMEPIWTKLFTRDTYSCIKNRGIHNLLHKLQSDLRKDEEGTKYCAKMDIKKFYPSIDHDILKQIIRRKVKDKNLLSLLDEIIDSAPGVPIGNYLSQYFANLYLAYFDHWVKEELRVKYYYRYADDLVLLSDDKQKLRNYILAIKLYLKQVLNLALKDNYQIFPVEFRGIDFVGYVCFHKYTLIRKSIKIKILKLVSLYQKGIVPIQELYKGIVSYLGWLKHCNSRKILHIIQQKTSIHYSKWSGVDTIIRNFKDKWVYIVNIERRNKYFLVQYIHNNKAYCIKSTSKRLFNLLQITNIIKL